MAGEQSFKAVINDTRPSAKGRSFSVEITGSNFNHFLGKKIGDSVEGMFVGDGEQTLNGYKLQITGGSDKTGRPMRSELDGGNVKSILITAGTGYKGKRYVRKNSKISISFDFADTRHKPDELTQPTSKTNRTISHPQTNTETTTFAKIPNKYYTTTTSCLKWKSSTMTLTKRK